MDISFYCIRCGQHIVIDEAGAGITVRCPKCGQSLTVPQAATASPSKASAPVKVIKRPGALPWRRIIVVASAVAVLAAAAVALFHWHSWRKPAQDVLERVSDSYWGEGVQDRRACKVLTVSQGGLVVTMTWHKIYNSEGNPMIVSESGVVALVNHPKEKSLAEGDTFSCMARREGTVEWKDTKGALRRLPRWVYVSSALLQFTGSIEAIDAKATTITLKKPLTDEAKTFTISPESRFATESKPEAALVDFIKGEKATAQYTEEGSTLTLVKLTQGDSGR